LIVTFVSRIIATTRPIFSKKRKQQKNQTLTKRDKKGGRTVKRLDTKIKKRENEIEVDF